jgi:hypothetical protein
VAIMVALVSKGLAGFFEFILKDLGLGQSDVIMVGDLYRTIFDLKQLPDTDYGAACIALQACCSQSTIPISPGQICGKKAGVGPTSPDPLCGYNKFHLKAQRNE